MAESSQCHERRRGRRTKAFQPRTESIASALPGTREADWGSANMDDVMSVTFGRRAHSRGRHSRGFWLRCVFPLRSRPAEGFVFPGEPVKRIIYLAITSSRGRVTEAQSQDSGSRRCACHRLSRRGMESCHIVRGWREGVSANCCDLGLFRRQQQQQQQQ